MRQLEGFIIGSRWPLFETDGEICLFLWRGLCPVRLPGVFI